MARISEQARRATRTRLLETAAQHFAQHGLDAANINRISVDAGLAKGTVYNYFPSKEALFLAVVEHACALAAEGGHDVPRDASTADRLRALLRSDVAWAAAHEPFARVLVRQALSGDPAMHERVLMAAAPYVQAVIEVLEDGVREGTVRDDIPVPQLALVFTGLGELGLVQHWGTGGAWPPLDAIPDLMVTLFVHGAAPRRRDP